MSTTPCHYQVAPTVNAMQSPQPPRQLPPDVEQLYYNTAEILKRTIRSKATINPMRIFFTNLVSSLDWNNIEFQGLIMEALDVYIQRNQRHGEAFASAMPKIAEGIVRYHVAATTKIPAAAALRAVLDQGQLQSINSLLSTSQAQQQQNPMQGNTMYQPQQQQAPQNALYESPKTTGQHDSTWKAKGPAVQSSIPSVLASVQQSQMGTVPAPVAQIVSAPVSVSKEYDDTDISNGQAKEIKLRGVSTVAHIKALSKLTWLPSPGQALRLCYYRSTHAEYLTTVLGSVLSLIMKKENNVDYKDHTTLQDQIDDDKSRSNVSDLMIGESVTRTVKKHVNKVGTCDNFPTNLGDPDTFEVVEFASIDLGRVCLNDTIKRTFNVDEQTTPIGMLFDVVTPIDGSTSFDTITKIGSLISETFDTGALPSWEKTVGALKNEDGTYSPIGNRLARRGLLTANALLRNCVGMESPLVLDTITELVTLPHYMATNYNQQSEYSGNTPYQAWNDEQIKHIVLSALTNIVYPDDTFTLRSELHKQYTLGPEDGDSLLNTFFLKERVGVINLPTNFEGLDIKLEVGENGVISEHLVPDLFALINGFNQEAGKHATIDKLFIKLNDGSSFRVYPTVMDTIEGFTIEYIG